MKFHIDQKLIDDGYISVRKHPEFDYYIYNYTNKTQYEQYWNEQTLQCRGLILDGDNNIIAKPFPKFFNLQEHQQKPWLPDIPLDDVFEVWVKADGSLGILYPTPDGNDIRVATRGSFDSPQALKATEMLDKTPVLQNLVQNYTILVEIIYPENKIVVDYGNKEILFLLAVINNETGEEWAASRLEDLSESSGLPLICYCGKKRPSQLITYPNQEGYVLNYYSDGKLTKVKLKFEEYVRLHKIMTCLSEKDIWESLKDNKPVSDILNNVPDEYFDRVKEVEKEYINKFEEIEDTCLQIVNDLQQHDSYNDRKYVASQFMKNKKLASVCFAIYDGIDYSEIIWKQLKPKYPKIIGKFGDEK